MDNVFAFIYRYWDIPFSTNTELSNNQFNLINNFSTLFKDSVIKRLVSDVPVGMVLSGGIDSCAILYEASEAGVEIDLVIRRHCVLRPGVPGMSSRIRVKSIVGRFLEHSRIYMFGGGHSVSAKSSVVYFGSADLMPRNLDERAELLVPVENSRVKSIIVDGILHANIKDNIQSWMLDSENNYERTHTKDGFCSQSFFMEADNPAILGAFEFASSSDKVSNESSS